MRKGEVKKKVKMKREKQPRLDNASHVKDCHHRAELTNTSSLPHTQTYVPLDRFVLKTTPLLSVALVTLTT